MLKSTHFAGNFRAFTIQTRTFLYCAWVESARVECARPEDPVYDVFMLRFRDSNNGALVYETEVLSTRPWDQEKCYWKIFMYLLILIDRHSFLWKSIDNPENPSSREGPKYESQRSYSEKNGSLKYLVLGWFGVHRGPKVTPHQDFSWSSTFNFIALNREGCFT